MPQLDKLTYFSQFFWLCILLFTFYVLLFNNNNGILGISRILKLRNQLLSRRGNKIQSKDPKNLEDISRKGFSTGLSYMYSSLSEVSQWCKILWASIYVYFYLHLPRRIIQLLFYIFLSLLTIRLGFLLFHFTAFFFAAEALVFASSYHGASAQAYKNMMFFGDDDLSRAVAQYLPRGGPAPLNIPQGEPLTIEEEEHLALVLNYHRSIADLLKWIDATSVISHRLEQESCEDLAAATLQHKDGDLHDLDQLWVVLEGLLQNGNSSRYYWRAVHWVVAEQKVRNGDLSPYFIIEDDGEV
jgi:hypothetical protein